MWHGNSTRYCLVLDHFCWCSPQLRSLERKPRTLFSSGPEIPWTAPRFENSFCTWPSILNFCRKETRVWGKSARWKRLFIYPLESYRGRKMTFLKQWLSYHIQPKNKEVFENMLIIHFFSLLWFRPVWLLGITKKKKKKKSTRDALIPHFLFSN